MRFSVDAHAIGRRLTGNEVYVTNLLKGFAALDRSAEFMAYVSSGRARASVPERFTVRRVSANPFVRLGCDLPRRLRLDRPQLLHVQYTAPLGCRVPVVASVHDISFEEHPEFFQPLRLLQLRYTVPRTVRASARVLTSSEFSRRQIARAYGVDPEKVVAIANAAGPGWRPLPRGAASVAALQRFGIRAPFVLSVGDLHPRKNQVGLIRAFAGMLRAQAGLAHSLVLVGQDTWFSPQVRRAARESGVAERVVFTGFVADEELLKLYNACEFFVFPSFYEGFGLPVLEAMACGRAVACSNTSALPEVADAAALLFDPASGDEIARAMLDLILDAELRQRMERLALARSTQFHWHKTAEKTLEVYYQVAAGARRADRKVQHASRSG